MYIAPTDAGAILMKKASVWGKTQLCLAPEAVDADSRNIIIRIRNTASPAAT